MGVLLCQKNETTIAPPPELANRYTSTTEFPDDEWFQSLLRYTTNKGILSPSEDMQTYRYNPLEFDPHGLEAGREFATMSKKLVIGETNSLKSDLLREYRHEYPRCPNAPTWEQFIQKVWAEKLESTVRKVWREVAHQQKLCDDNFKA